MPAKTAFGRNSQELFQDIRSTKFKMLELNHPNLGRSKIIHQGTEMVLTPYHKLPERKKAASTLPFFIIVY